MRVKSIVIICCFFIFSTLTIQAKDDLDLDPEQVDVQDNQDAISSSYNGFDFFAKEDIEKSEQVQKQKATTLQKEKNTLFLQEKQVETKKYKNITEQVFTTMFVYRTKEEETNKIELLYVMGFIALWGCSTIFAYGYYKKKNREKEKTE